MKDTHILKILKLTILHCDKPERSGRIYPVKLVKKAIKEDKVLQERLVNNCLFGDMFRNDIDEVDMQEVAFAVKKLYWYKKELRAVIDILDTPNGRVLAQCPTAIRGSVLGSGEVDFTTNTVTDYKVEKFCITWDL